MNYLDIILLNDLLIRRLEVKQDSLLDALFECVVKIHFTLVSKHGGHLLAPIDARRLCAHSQMGVSRARPLSIVLQEEAIIHVLEALGVDAAVAGLLLSGPGPHLAGDAARDEELVRVGR